MPKNNITCILIECSKDNLNKIKESDLEIYGFGLYEEENQENSKEI